MDCSKKRASAVGDLPVDPLVEILSRVPAKSVCRFKCVSKAWRDLIADPHHRKKLPQAMQGLFCHTAKESEAGLSYSFSFIDLVPRSVPLDIDPCFSFLTELPEIQTLVLSDSCSGLVLFMHFEKQNSTTLGYVVCNPTTKEWEVVPACGAPTSEETYPCVAFDPAVPSHFNLVQFLTGDNEEFLSVHVYSSETGAWSENLIDEQGEEGQFPGWRNVSFPLARLYPCPFINGFLHFMVWDQDETKIVALDAQGKGRRMIPVPHVAEMGVSICYFGESQGKLHFMTEKILNDDHEYKYKLFIWVLQDYNAQEWVLKCTVNSHEVFGENSAKEGSMEFEVVGIHQDRNVIFFTHPSGRHKLVAYDMDREELCTIATFDDQEWLMDTARYVPFF
ncbi:unnamed protein product [Urochloa decumbens]|uniref:F-box domain-containing protein n=1 Tax=Urochloa decumbens TaxID=240449 RepID=A0ABC9FN95_9POAL